MTSADSIRRWTSLARWAQQYIVLFILALGTGVFFWGTAYKMSLYESSPIHNKVAVAKLSTDSRKANKDQVESATMPRPVTAFPLLLDLALFFILQSLFRGDVSAVPTDKPRQLVRFYFPPASFLRPPPFSFHG